MSCNLCYHGAFWTAPRGRERLHSARMFADWLASVHMHEFKPSLVTKLPRTATKNKFACPIRAAARLCEGGFGPPKISSPSTAIGGSWGERFWYSASGGLPSHPHLHPYDGIAAATCCLFGPSIITHHTRARSLHNDSPPGCGQWMHAPSCQS